MNDMPRLNIDAIRSTRAAVYAMEIVNPRTGRLYANCPAKSGEVRYVWRMVAFYLSPRARHQAVPVTADWGLHLPYDQRSILVQQLDELVVDPIVDSVDPLEWHGVRRWAEVL